MSTDVLATLAACLFALSGFTGWKSMAQSNTDHLAGNEWKWPVNILQGLRVKVEPAEQEEVRVKGLGQM